MLKSLNNILNNLLGFLLPERPNFSLVKNLDEKTINSLPKAPPLDGADWIHPLFHYKDRKVKAIIWELKYKENVKPLEHISKMIFDELIDLASDVVMFDSDAEFLLIPIPISKERRIERGFNQSEYIAKSILENDFRHTFIYAPQFLQKIIDTPTQSHSHSKEERMKNLANCFEADPRVEGKYIILIDDVVTTGSTLMEAKKVLLHAGAKNVYAFTIAH